MSSRRFLTVVSAFWIKFFWINVIDKKLLVVIEYIKEAKSRKRKGRELMERDDRLIKLYSRVYSKPKCVRALKLVGGACVLYVAAVFAFGCILVGVREGLLALLRLVLMAAIPFALVSLMRLLFNLERPYELVNFLPFEKMKAERKAGRSFPSRHVFSAFLIGALLITVSPAVGVLTLLVGAFLALERVMLGIHFPKDVIVGAIVGLVSGIVGTLFL